MRAPYSQNPAVAPTLGLIGGILLYDKYWDIQDGQIGLATLVAALCAVAGVALLMAVRTRFWAFPLLAVAVGCMVAYLHRPTPMPVVFAGTDRNVHGTVRSSSAGVTNIDLLVDVDAVDSIPLVSPVRMAVTLRNASVQPLAGAEISCSGRLYGPTPESELERDYNARHMRELGVAAMMSVRNGAVDIIAQGHGWRAWCERLRNRMIDGLYNSSLRQETSDLLTGLVCGDSGFMHPATRGAYRSTGVAHILALSGFHVMVLAMSVSLLTFPLWCIPRVGRIRFLMTLLAAWLFVAVTGWSVSAVRAAILLSILMTGRMVQRNVSAINSLAIAAALMLAVSPAWLYSAGFQLSFAAVIGLVLLADKLNPISRRRWLFRRVYEAVCVPVVAMLATSMISVAYFNQLPLLFLPANLLVAITAPLLIGGGIVFCVLGACGVEARWLNRVLDVVTSLTNDGVGRLSSLSGTTLDELYVSGWIVAAWYAALLLAVLALYGRRIWPAILAVAALCAGYAVHIRFYPAKCVPDELFIPADWSELRIVGRSGKQAWIYSNADPGHRQQTYLHADDRYAGWLDRTDSKPFRLLGTGVTADSALWAIVADIDSGPSVGRYGLNAVSACGMSTLRLRRGVILAGEHTLAMIESSQDIKPMKVEYLLLCSSRRKLDLDSAVKVMQPGAVVLAPNLSRKRRRRLLKQLHEINVTRQSKIPVHNAADSAFHLQWGE